MTRTEFLYIAKSDGRGGGGKGGGMKTDLNKKYLDRNVDRV